MLIRPAVNRDIPAIRSLLLEINLVHHEGRPDLFSYGKGKYTEEELRQILQDPSRPIFVAENEKGQVVAHAFCLFQQHHDDPVLTPIRTLYIDDICVTKICRGQHIGRKIYDYIVTFAKDQGFYNITLNVWSLNETALKFYEACGLLPQKITMEKIL